MRVEQCRAALAQALGPGFEVDPPASRGKQFDSVLRLYSMTMSITSLFALFIGMFIIYNSFAIAVTQRRAEIGILGRWARRAAGARPVPRRERRPRRGGFGARPRVRVPAGPRNRGYLGQMLQGISGIAQRAEDVATDPRLMALAFGMGIATSMVAAFIPARNAARVDPVQALQKGKYQVLSAGENRIGGGRRSRSR